MITSQTIKKLTSFIDSDFPILSVHLGANTLHSPSGDYLLTQLHSLLHKGLSKEQRITFEDDINKITEYLQDYIPSARSIVFFTGGESLWEVVKLEFSLPTSISISNSPQLKPIQDSLKKYSMYLVLLVDREKARMFTVEQGEMVDHSEYIGSEVPQLSKSTGRDSAVGKSDINFRHNELLLSRHIAKTAKAVADFTKTKDVHFVIIGGHSEIFKKVAAALPQGLRSKIADTFVTEVNIPLNELLLESKKLASSVR